MARLGPLLVGLAAVTPLVLAAQSDSPRFEVASIKPSPADALGGMMFSGPAPAEFSIRNAPLLSIIMVAYGRRDYQLVGSPDWTQSERYDIRAKYPNPDARRQWTAMLRALLEDRFRLRTHVETREAPVYALVMARGDKRFGPQLQKTPRDCAVYLAELAKAGSSRVVNQGDPCAAGVYGDGRGRNMWASGRTMAQIAAMLSGVTDRDVVDRTGLTGEFDVRLNWQPDAGIRSTPGQPGDGGVSLFTALQEQLGLKFESSRGPVEMLVIDSVERPTPD